MAEFNQLIGLVDSILEKKYDKEQKEATRVYEAIERKKARSFEREMRELGQKYELQKIAMSEQIKIKNQSLEELEKLENDYKKSVGSLPKKSTTFSNSMKVIENAYKQPVNNITDIIKLNTEETNIIKNEQRKIEEALSGVIQESKEYISKNYPQYVNIIEKDNILSPFEFDLLKRDFISQETDATIDNLVNVISINEQSGRSERNNNPGAMIYSPWMNKFGATKDESEAFWVSYDEQGNKTEYFNQTDADKAEADGIKVDKHYTAKFPTMEDGENALRMLVREKWAGSSGVSDFVESYTGLKSTTAEFENYSKIFDSLELLTSDESDIAEKVMSQEYYKTDDPSKQFYRAYAMRQNKADDFRTKANESYINLQELYLPRTTEDPTGMNHISEIVGPIFGLTEDDVKTLHEILTQPNAGAVTDYLNPNEDANPKSEEGRRFKNLKSLLPKISKDRLFKDLQTIGENITQIDAITNPQNQSENVNNLREIVRNSRDIKTATQKYFTEYFNNALYESGEIRFFDSEFRELMIDKFGPSVNFEINNEIKSLQPEVKLDSNRDNQVDILDIIQRGATENFLTDEGLLSSTLEENIDFILSDDTDVNKNSFLGPRALTPEFTDETVANYASNTLLNQSLNTISDISKNITEYTEEDFEKIFDKIQSGDSQRIVSPYAMLSQINQENK